MLWERKACLKAALVVILLFSLFGVSAMAMPSGTPFISITNSSNGSGYTILEPGDSLTDGNWIILHGGSEIDIPATTFHYSGNAFDHSIGTGLSGLPFFDQLEIGTEYDMAHVSLQDVTVPYTTYPVYTDVAGKNDVTATFNGDPAWDGVDLHVMLLDLTQVSDKIDFTSTNTITNSAKLLTLQDIRDSKIADVVLTADSSGDIAAIESSIPALSGMTQGYYMLLVVDESAPSLPCIVAEAPIIVTKYDMSTGLLDAAPKPGDSLTFIEDQAGATAGDYTYVVAMIPEADYTADISLTSDGTASGTSMRFQGLSLDETMQVTSDGTADGTTVHIQGLALDETLSKTDMENATLLKDLVMKELNQSDIAIGVRTTTGTTNVDVIVPTRDDMPMGNYIVLSAAVDRNTGRIAAINQTTMSMGYTITYDLVEGWNLIAVPVDLSDNSVDGFFPASVESEIWDLWGWDSSQQTWTYFSPDPLSPYQHFTRITTMDAGKGYWVNMNSSASFSVRGVLPAGSPNATVPLVSYWNLVGVTGMSSMPPDTMYPTAWDVWRWNATRQNWDYYSPDPNSPYNSFNLISTIEPGQGIWVNI